MHSDRMLSLIRDDIKNGPHLQSVVITALSHEGTRGYELLVRKAGGSSLESVCAWIGGDSANAHYLYDEVFDLVYECLTKLLHHEATLF
jgi:hypothetical protein